MEIPLRQKMGDYCRRNHVGKINFGFQLAKPVTFDLKNYVFLGLRDNLFDREVIRDPWKRLACFYETCSMYKPDGVTDDQELEDRFMERFFTNTKFVERKAEISNFEQGDIESLYDMWEIFKLLLKRYMNQNMSSMKRMQHFTRVLKAQARIILDASVGGTIKTNIEDEVKELIKKICQNEYLSQSEKGVKPKGVLDLDANIAMLAQLEVIAKQLAKATIIPANVSQVQILQCNFCGQGHAYGNCVTEGLVNKLNL
ncbi:uncharacterized protein LOC127130642 [Lathyrus oleraceus]|uniref:uncharacterized protein LOC127130642 n=1 Tax=Pisum sativum TaxID=3888 RepID=UPI0021D3662A|nr:uncharacterized protein LOC127130642 [Pisum sativum]